MRLASPPLSINDDLDLELLEKALIENIERLREVKNNSLIFGPKEISKEKYILSLEFLVTQLKENKDKFIEFLQSNFDFYEVYGKEKWGEVFITSYFAPVLSGSKERTPKHSEPLYKVPDDLVHIRLDQFVDINEELYSLKDSNSTKSKVGILRGRIVKEDQIANIIPYYTRQEIESQQKLKDQDIVLAWVDPIDSFSLHVQGSGTVVFEDGEELRLGYASQNGHKYYAIGKYLADKMPEQKITMQSIENYLRTISYKEMKNILYKNPSYIFFRELEGRPETNFGTETIDGRTIATDKSFFPKGALAYLEFPKPLFKDETSDEISSYEQKSRFVLDQDTGGAIKGTHRVDLFWGRGKEAGRYAGVMRNWGKLYYIVPKDEFIEQPFD
ncbi:MAG: MltA domain-containing protein [Thermodesulfobacteriota bacterium]